MRWRHCLLTKAIRIVGQSISFPSLTPSPSPYNSQKPPHTILTGNQPAPSFLLVPWCTLNKALLAVLHIGYSANFCDIGTQEPGIRGSGNTLISLFPAFDFSRSIKSGPVYVGVRATALVRLQEKVFCFGRNEVSSLRDIKNLAWSTEYYSSWSFFPSHIALQNADHTERWRQW